MITIDKGVPIPPSKFGSRQLIEKMEIGDSFLYPDCTMPQIRGLCQKAIKSGKKFVFRQQKLDDGKVIGFRAWRVE